MSEASVTENNDGDGDEDFVDAPTSRSSCFLPVPGHWQWCGGAAAVGKGELQSGAGIGRLLGVLSQPQIPFCFPAAG